MGSERTVTIDRSGVIRQWGGDMEGVYGYTPEEAVGREIDLIIPPVLRRWHHRGFDKAVRTGSTRKKPGAAVRVPAVHKDGTIISVRAILELTHAHDGSADGAMAKHQGQDRPWAGHAWRPLLAALKLTQLRRKQPRARAGT